ncbi:MAG: hypothetical protein JXA21_15725 [Anaerolineae bacterium]|nr:hypothetical protein [Anaerolineae bacterium]
MEETVQLRPRGIGELLDQAVRLYRRNFFTFIGIVAVMQIPLTLISTVVTRYTNTSTRFLSQSEQIERTGIMLGGFLILMVASFVLQGIVMAALARAIADNYMGEKTGFMDAYRKIGKDWPRVLAALLIGGLIYFGLVIWLIIPCIGWFTGLGALIMYLTRLLYFES